MGQDAKQKIEYKYKSKSKLMKDKIFHSIPTVFFESYTIQTTIECAMMLSLS